MLLWWRALGSVKRRAESVALVLVETSHKRSAIYVCFAKKKVKMGMLKNEYLMRIAELTAGQSHCRRAQVGCVIADPTLEVFTVGYNGTYKGGPNTCRGPNEPGKCGCVHAEVNAIAKAGRGEKIAYVTLAPCIPCATLLVNADVTTVYFRNTYRSADGLDLLREAGVPVFKL
jgi:dCMP deaminase